MRIAVVGFSGSGKSSLAAWLGDRLGAEVLHLDKVQFLPGWEIRPLEEKQELVRAFLDSRSAWVIDGNYTKLSYERRLAEADRILVLMLPRAVRLLRVLRRYRRYRGLGRPDMAEGCAEKLDGEFVRWVLWEGCSREKRRRMRSLAVRFPEKTVLLRSQKQIDSFKRDFQRELSQALPSAGERKNREREEETCEKTVSSRQR